MRMTPPRIVDVASLARYILSKDCRSIAFLTGAGVSCASGIPDFRSPGGMYDTLRPDLITATPSQRRAMEWDPTNVVSYEIFQETSLPYLEVRRPFILGTARKRWKATIAHRFMELLHTKTNKLTRIYTQNIDGLDHQCDDIPPDKIVNVHGTLSQAACEDCGQAMDYQDFCSAVETQIKDIYKLSDAAPTESTPIVCPHCGKPQVKPTTVLFGRPLPSEFFDKTVEDLPSVDLLIVAGTSLVVAPANSLVYNVAPTTVRVIVNTQPVGAELGIDYDDESGRDFFAQGSCDQVFLNLIRELGWLNDLQDKLNQLPEESAKLVVAAAARAANDGQ